MEDSKLFIRYAVGEWLIEVSLVDAMRYHVRVNVKTLQQALAVLLTANRDRVEPTSGRVPLLIE